MIEFSRAYRFFLLLSLTTTSSIAAAQAQTKPTTIRLSPEDEARGQYGAQRNFFFLSSGQTGEDNYQSAGFFGQKLRPYLENSPTALAELDKYSRQKTLFLIDRGVVLGAVIVYGSQVFGHGDAQYFSGTQQVAIGAAAVGILATLFINHHTNDYLKQAVDTYNTDSPGTRHGTLWPRLRPAGVGLGATAQGQPTLGLRWQL